MNIFTDQLEQSEIDDLSAHMQRCDDINMVGQAVKWNRLFGGAGIVILTNQDPKTPLNIKQIQKDSDLDFRAIDMWELYYDTLNIQDEQFKSMEPTKEVLQGREYYNYYGHDVHASRIMVMRGKEPPSFVRPRLRGWGVSIVETLVRSINQFLKSNNLVFEVLDEFKLDIFKIKGLVETLSAAGAVEKIQNRMNLATQEKSYKNAITMDAEDDYVQKQLTFGGIADIMKELRNQIASDMRIPQTKLFGQSSAGFNSGEDDIEVYNSMVEGSVRSKVRYDILRVVELRSQQMFGFIPDDLTIEFEPLRVLSSTQEQEVKTSEYNRLLMAQQAGLITAEEFRDGCNSEGLLPISLEETTQDFETRDLEEDGIEEGDV